MTEEFGAVCPTQDDRQPAVLGQSRARRPFSHLLLFHNSQLINNVPPRYPCR